MSSDTVRCEYGGNATVYCGPVVPGARLVGLRVDYAPSLWAYLCLTPAEVRALLHELSERIERITGEGK